MVATPGHRDINRHRYNGLGPNNLQSTPVFENLYRLPPAQNENYANYLCAERKLHKLSSGADYIAAVPRSLYSVAFFTDARFEHYTSNVVKAANALFLEERELPVLDMLHGILEKEMDCRPSRQGRPVAWPFTLYGTVKFTVQSLFSEGRAVSSPVPVLLPSPSPSPSLFSFFLSSSPWCRHKQLITHFDTSFLHNQCNCQRNPATTYPNEWPAQHIIHHRRAACACTHTPKK